MSYNVTGTAANDTLNQSADGGPGTIVGLEGADSILTGSGLVTVAGGAGNDTVILQAGNTGTVDGGADNDNIVTTAAIGSMVIIGNDGADTVNTFASSAAQTILGGA